MKAKIDGTQEEQQEYWDRFFDNDGEHHHGRNDESGTEKLFVYGIFLGEGQRNAYGMTNPRYATVPGYITVGHHIVQAVPVNSKDIALTGLLVDMDSSRWRPLDSLEGGYDRVKVVTDGNVEAWMYVQPQAR